MSIKHELSWRYLVDLMNGTREKQDSINLNLLIEIMEGLEAIEEIEIIKEKGGAE